MKLSWGNEVKKRENIENSRSTYIFPDLCNPEKHQIILELIIGTMKGQSNYYFKNVERRFTRFAKIKTSQNGLAYKNPAQEWLYTLNIIS